MAPGGGSAAVMPRGGEGGVETVGGALVFGGGVGRPISPGIGRSPAAGPGVDGDGPERPISPGIGRPPATAPSEGGVDALRVSSIICPTVLRDPGDGIALAIRSHWSANTSIDAGGISDPIAQPRTAVAPRRAPSGSYRRESPDPSPPCTRA